MVSSYSDVSQAPCEVLESQPCFRGGLLSNPCLQDAASAGETPFPEGAVEAQEGGSFLSGVSLAQGFTLPQASAPCAFLFCLSDFVISCLFLLVL